MAYIGFQKQEVEITQLWIEISYRNLICNRLRGVESVRGQILPFSPLQAVAG